MWWCVCISLEFTLKKASIIKKQKNNHIQYARKEPCWLNPIQTWRILAIPMGLACPFSLQICKMFSFELLKQRWSFAYNLPLTNHFFHSCLVLRCYSLALNLWAVSLIDISSAITRCFEQNEQGRYQLTDGGRFFSKTQIFKAAFLREDEKTPWNNKGSTIHAEKCPQSIIHFDPKVPTVHCDHVGNQ